MKIAFLDGSHLAYGAATPFQRPLGGTQSAVCYLAASLARRGHDVTLFNNSREPTEALNVKVHPHFRASEAVRYNQFDVLVLVSIPAGRRLRQSGVSTALVHWQHQSTSSRLVSDYAVEGEREAWDRIVFVSDHQRRQFAKAFQLEGMVLRNAPAPPFSALAPRSDYFFENGRPPRFVYSSAPGRGLDFLLIAFPSIRAAVPGATLQVYSDQKLYQVDAEKDDYSVYYELARAIPGVNYHGSVSQTQLAEEFCQADAWLYPTTFVETSCIALMEAGSAGCGLICSSVGALPETANGFATVFDPPTNKAMWSKQFATGVAAWVEAAQADPAAARSRLQSAKDHFRAMTWDLRAAEWETMFADLVSGPSDRPPVP